MNNHERITKKMQNGPKEMKANHKKMNNQFHEKMITVKKLKAATSCKTPTKR